MLFPLPKPRLLSLDLLREPLPQLLLLLLELRVIQLLHLWLAELPRLHLLLPVVLVVGVLRCADEVQHVRPDEERAELAEITVILVLNYQCVLLGQYRFQPSQEEKSNGPSATPQRYSRPLTTLPSCVRTSSVDPMMENGMASRRIRPWSAVASSSASIGG
jgi:hypothetical protein